MIVAAVSKKKNRVQQAVYSLHTIFFYFMN